MNAAFFAAVLEPEGHTVTLAITGPAGRTLALEELFDLIALDIELPGLRGDALCQQLRAEGVRTPMVALTASAMPDQLAAIAVAGFDECMTKPIDPGDLRAMARRFDPSPAPLGTTGPYRRADGSLPPR